ncbi:MAG: hypothetical protein ABI579_09245, partial [Candidatus Sumerlaeota bacterium]
MSRLKLSLAALLASAIVCAQAQPAPSPIMPSTPPSTAKVPTVMRTPGPISLQKAPEAPAVANAAMDKAPLKFDKILIDGGTREEGDTVEFDYPVTNSGTKK